MASDLLRILVIDSHEEFRTLMTQTAEILADLYNIECQFASNSEEAFQCIESQCPSIVFIDSHVGDINLFDFCQTYHSGLSALIVTSTHPNEEFIELAYTHGASVVLHKSEDPDELEGLLSALAERVNSRSLHIH